jgi:hypothetical protein
LSRKGKHSIWRRLQSRERLAVLLIGLVGAAFAWWWWDGEAGAVLGALGISALLFGAIQFRDAKSTIRNLEQISDGLERSTGRVEGLREELASSTAHLEEQLSTRRAGVFPSFVPKIVDLLRSANKSVLIFCDFPAYGDFSSPHSSEYAAAVEEKGDKVSLLCLGQVERSELASAQIPAEDWNAWLRAHSDALRAFFKRCEPDGNHDYRTIARDALLPILDERDTRALDNEFAQATVHTTSLVMPLYFWIVDGERAIFSLAPLLKADALEVGFHTTDTDLITALGDIFERYRQSATHYPHKTV